MATRAAGAAGAQLDFVDCSYTIKSKRKSDGQKTKTLLANCSVSVRPGEVLAIMGPSGAGKTTLLNTLTLEPSGGTPYGSVTLNGNPFTLAVYKRHAAVVQQADSLWTFMTARDHVLYATRLYQPRREAGAYADTMLKEMGLEGCQHVIAGNVFLKGLSGGQRRRLSLAVALTKEPSVVFLDEPTSGLDAAAAASIMAFLRDNAPRLQTAMVCTIHQPSTSVFAGFDKVCFLAGGHICYLGAASELDEYLASLGRPVPEHSNPADFMLDLTNRDFTDGATVDQMVSLWAEKQREVVVMDAAPLGAASAATFGGQLRVLLGKHLRNVMRDPTLYSARFFIFILVSCFISILYIEQRSTRQDQARPPAKPRPQHARRPMTATARLSGPLVTTHTHGPPPGSARLATTHPVAPAGERLSDPTPKPSAAPHLRPLRGSSIRCS